MQDSFKNMFPRDEKIKLAVAGVSENERRKWFSLATKSVLLARIRLFIINCISWFPLLAEKKKSIVSTKQKIGFHSCEWRIRLRIRFC